MPKTQIEQQREDHVHNEFCSALIEDFRRTTRYVALHQKNGKTFSVEFVRLCLDICSETEALAKLFCERREPTALAGIKRPTISDWGAVLRRYPPEMSSMTMLLDHWIYVTPWRSWKKKSKGKYNSPDWWEAYQLVKHDRTEHFEKATQDNVIAALCGLATIAYVLIPGGSWMSNSRFLMRY